MSSLSLPVALTTKNVLRELKDVSWETLSKGKYISSGEYMSPGVLRLPNSQRHKIEAEYSTEDQQKIAAVQFWLASDPCASWRRLARQLDWLEEQAVAKQIYPYVEKLTGMICKHQSNTQLLNKHFVTIIQKGG